MINARIQSFRQKMMEHQIDCYIIPSSDAHQSEYVAEHWQCRAWISGFTGSVGTVVITSNKACLWVDGRYHVQAEKQLKGSEFILMKQGLQGVPNFIEWIEEEMQEGQTIGFDGHVMASSIYKELLHIGKKKVLKFKMNDDLMDHIWEDRPPLPKKKAFVLDTSYAGKTRLEKIRDVREEMKKLGGESYLIPNLDDLCWLFNIRGNDVKFSPVVIGYGLVTMSEASLFIDECKLSESVRAELEGDNIRILTYDYIKEYLEKMDVTSMIYTPALTSISLIKALKPSVKCIEEEAIASRLKGIKNDTEIKNLRECQIIDGIAMVRFIKWLTENLDTDQITELTVEEQLRLYRGQHKLYRGESFNTIAAYGENAAMMHYAAKEDSFSHVEMKGFLLVDSGGQYLNGTTDITRTFAVGTLTEEEKLDYTLTLQAHIALARAIFLHGTTGPHLDILARKPMWDNGLDYKCGTGHGVGFFMNVHEGPQTIRNNNNNVALEKGMILTNEPGVYKAGRHGVRIENTMLVVDAFTTECGEFYKFETISYCPIDLKGVLVERLTEEEKRWINAYHQMAYEKLSPFMTPEEVDFLRSITIAI
ncbi:aminopeptidase P family protein [Vallitalea okinawensis]|uniref:aminopeptidase P family protein n=1 Tax=Vallitalea okinawensis TaxID=2078660 RepID=UPI00241D04A2|nr:aminopeptidase P family protein [Vallitalea okinawensis]